MAVNVQTANTRYTNVDIFNRIKLLKWKFGLNYLILRPIHLQEKADCYKELSFKYKFLLTFETTFCKDYISDYFYFVSKNYFN